MSKMSRTFVAIAMVMALFVHESEQRIDGAPVAACGPMTPNHRGILPQSIPSPYTVVPSASSMPSGSTITVTLSSGSNPIRGFMLQARNAAEIDGIPIGEWTAIPALTKSIACEKNNDAVTHSSIDVKPTLVFTWKAPAQFTGRVVFRATVAEVYDTFWIKNDSNAVTVN